MKRVIYYGLIVLFAVVFLVCAWNLGSYYLDALENDSHFSALAQIVEDAKNEPQPTVYYTRPDSAPEATEDPSLEPDTPTLPEFESDPETVLPEYARLYLRNPDMVGWIRIEGTAINHPVMQTPSYANYYLYKNFDKQYSNFGSVYAKEECDVFTPSDNVTLYGHSMYSGSMFHDLHKYLDRDFWAEHRYITFDSLLEHRTYEIIAVFATTASVGEGFRYHTFINAANEEEFNEFISTCKELAYYDTGVTAQYGDKLLTLSTCEYTHTNGRLVVVAKLIETD